MVICFEKTQFGFRLLVYNLGLFGTHVDSDDGDCCSLMFKSFQKVKNNLPETLVQPSKFYFISITFLYFLAQYLDSELHRK